MRYEVKTRADGTVAVFRSEREAIAHAINLTRNRNPRVAVVFERQRKNHIPLGAVTVEEGLPVRASSLVMPCEKMVDKIYEELLQSNA